VLVRLNCFADQAGADFGIAESAPDGGERIADFVSGGRRTRGRERQRILQVAFRAGEVALRHADLGEANVAHDAITLEGGRRIGNAGANGKGFTITGFGSRHIAQIAEVGIALDITQAVIAAGDLFQEFTIAAASRTSRS